MCPKAGFKIDWEQEDEKSRLEQARLSVRLNQTGARTDQACWYPLPQGRVIGVLKLEKGQYILFKRKK